VWINSKWPNLDLHLFSSQKTPNVSCDQQTLYSLGGVSVPAFEILPVILWTQMEPDNELNILWCLQSANMRPFVVDVKPFTKIRHHNPLNRQYGTNIETQILCPLK